MLSLLRGPLPSSPDFGQITKLELPEGNKSHPVFCVSKCKKFVEQAAADVAEDITVKVIFSHECTAK